LAAGASVPSVEEMTKKIVDGHLGRMDQLCDKILDGSLTFDRWPLSVPIVRPLVGEAMDANQRAAMVREIELEMRETAELVGRSAMASHVLAAMGRVPRHEFVPESEREFAYYNGPLPIGHGQTISQPFIVALMTDLLDVDETAVVLEVGAGCGYQSAVLAELVRQVYGIEIVEPLARQAKERLARLGYRNVEIKAGDGYGGWPEHAPYDGIVVTAGADMVPPPLIEQLKPGGRMVIPVGRSTFGQDLMVIEKSATGDISERVVLPVAFVPFTGKHGAARSHRVDKETSEEQSDDA